MQRARFRSVDEGIVNDEQSAGGQRLMRALQQRLHLRHVPIVEHIGEQMHIAVRRQPVEHVRRHDFHPPGTATLLDQFPADAIHRSLIHDHAAHVRMMGNDGAGVDARAATDIQDPGAPGQIQALRQGLRQVEAAAVHCGGEAARKILLLHGLVPVESCLVSGPAGRLSGAEDFDKIAGNRPVMQRGKVRAEVPDRRLHQVLTGGFRAMKHTVFTGRNQTVRRKQREHRVRRPGLEVEV